MITSQKNELMYVTTTYYITRSFWVHQYDETISILIWGYITSDLIIFQMQTKSPTIVIILAIRLLAQQDENLYLIDWNILLQWEVKALKIQNLMVGWLKKFLEKYLLENTLFLKPVESVVFFWFLLYINNV